MTLGTEKRVVEPHWFLRPDGTDGYPGIHGAAHALRVATHACEIADECGLAERERDALHL